MAEQRFPYGTQRGVLTLAIVFFGACGALFTHAGLSGKAVRLWPLPVTTTGGPVIALAALSFAFVVVGAAQIVAGYRLGPRELVVAPTFIEAPSSPWTRRTLRVTRASIRSVKQTDVAGTRVLEIVCDGGKLALSNRTVGDAGLAAVHAWLKAS